jgi:hypothetical protein
METSVPASVVIEQDDGTEIHVQPVFQSGRRHLDVRIWRRGPSGFAPSRNALVVRVDDLPPFRQGIAELLEASNGGRQAARIVWDDDDTRRLRAETEPFGTRFLASFAFWQRVRDSWKAADDGLVLAADRLEQLQDVLARLSPWMEEKPPDESEPEEDALQRHALYGWPSPGADWITVAPGHIAFHPRGIRITCTVSEEDDRRSIVLRQWRRVDSLWVPEDTALPLTVVDLDTLLFAMAQLLEDRAGAGATTTVPCSGESTLRLVVSGREHEETLTLEQEATADEAGERRRLSLPYEYVPRFGRMLLQAGSFLAAGLSEEERETLQSGEHASPSVVAYDSLPEAIRYEVAHGPARSDGGKAEADGASPHGDGAGEALLSVTAHAHHGLLHAADRSSGSDGNGEPTEELPAVRVTPLQEVELGGQLVMVALQSGRQSSLALTWNNRFLSLPLDILETLTQDVRELYYDALRGRRGQPLTIIGEPPVTVSIHNEGSRMYCAVQSGVDGSSVRLQFPANQVPLFLDATRAALTKLEREITA